MGHPSSPRQIVIVVYPGVQSLDVAGPLEVFSGASQLVGPGGRPRRRGYEIRIVSSDGAALSTSSGMTLTPHFALEQAPAQIDTLIVAGGTGCMDAADDSALVDW